MERGKALLRVFYSSDSGTGRTLSVAGSEKEYCIDAPALERYDLMFRTAGSRVALDDLYLFAGRQSLLLYDREGRPGPSVDAVRDLNRQLVRQDRSFFSREAVRELSGMRHDFWTGTLVRGRIDVPLDLAGNDFTVVSHLPENWPVRPEAVFAVGGVKMPPVTIGRGRNEIVFPGTKFVDLRGRQATLEILVKKAVRPADYKINDDRRELGFQLLSVGFQKRKTY